jgi:hypothetical protein
MPRRRSPPDKNTAPPGVPPSWEQCPDLSRISRRPGTTWTHVRRPVRDHGATMMSMTAVPTGHCIQQRARAAPALCRSALSGPPAAADTSEALSASMAGDPEQQGKPMRREPRGVANRTILDMINFRPPGTPITARRALQNVLQNPGCPLIQPAPFPLQSPVRPCPAPGCLRGRADPRRAGSPPSPGPGPAITPRPLFWRTPARPAIWMFTFAQGR